jgi:hypothetical protein
LRSIRQMVVVPIMGLVLKDRNLFCLAVSLRQTKNPFSEFSAAPR